MKKKKVKLILLANIIIGMITYIGWVFSISEPEYINNNYKLVEKYDYVSLRKYKMLEETKWEVSVGIVLQVDSLKALILDKSGYRDTYNEILLSDSTYRIVGKGTLYHKVNYYTGFNILMISQIFSTILLLILIVVTCTLFYELYLKEK